MNTSRKAIAARSPKKKAARSSAKNEVGAGKKKNRKPKEEGAPNTKTKVRKKQF